MISYETKENIAQQTLNNIADQVELQTNLDVEIEQSQLTICDNKKQTFLLNFHGVTNQIWLSSPLTGAHHFSWNGVDWISTRAPISLNTVLQADISELFKEVIKL